MGAKRPAAWFNYFKDAAIYPIVVTRHWDHPIKMGDDTVKPSLNQHKEVEATPNGTIIRVPFRPNLRDRVLLKYGRNRFSIFRKVLSLVNYVGALFHEVFDEKWDLYKAAEEYLGEEKVDCIIATGEPFILFRYAYLLNRKFDIPWIADYRDGWTLNYNVSIANPVKRFIYHKVIQPKEKRFLQTASLILTVSKSLSIDLKGLHNRQVDILPNGYDDEAILKLTSGEKKRKPFFSLAYSGTLYPYQRLETFLSAFKKFVHQRSLSPYDVQVNFYGTSHYPDNGERVLSYDTALRPYLNVTSRMPYRELLQNLSENHICLVFANENIDGSAAKIFDYLALRKPTLVSVNDHGTLEELIQETRGGVLCESESEVEAALYQYYDEYLACGDITSSTINEMKYSRKASTAQLATWIKSLCAE